jgi:hypothetical protein
MVWPGCPDKGDISGWLKEKAEDLGHLVEQAQEIGPQPSEALPA